MQVVRNIIEAKEMEFVRETANVIPMFSKKETVTTADENAEVRLTDFVSLDELKNHFSTEEICIQYFISMRWKHGVICPYCCHNEHHTTDRVHKYENKYKWKCNDCERNFTYTVGTTFQNTKITLKKWFIAIFLNNNDAKTTKDIQENLDVTKATAFEILQKLFAAVSNANDRFIFGKNSVLESDESGDKAENKNKATHKKDVNCQGRSLQLNTKIWFGLADRVTRKLKLFHIPTTHENYIIGLIQRCVAAGATINTDKFSAYDSLETMYNHLIVDHSKKEWANGNITTNLMEGIWACVKRVIQHIYRSISYKYTQMYLNAFVNRFNFRFADNQHKFEDTIQESANQYVTSWEIQHGLAA